MELPPLVRVFNVYHQEPLARFFDGGVAKKTRTYAVHQAGGGEPAWNFSQPSCFGETL
jgi:hypothetical protein